MSKIIGITVGTPFKHSSIPSGGDVVKTVNGISPDENGNVDVSCQGGGQAGGYYIPEIDENGNLSWSPSNEGMPEVEDTNVKGDKGDAGATGSQGPKGDTGEAGAAGVGIIAITITEVK